MVKPNRRRDFAQWKIVFVFTLALIPLPAFRPQKIAVLPAAHTHAAGSGHSREDIVRQQSESRMFLHNALLLVVQADRAKELLGFMDTHAFYAVPVGPILTEHVIEEDAPDSRTDPMAFEIVFVPPNLMPPGQHFSWDAAERVLRIGVRFSSRSWLAVSVFHQLEHVWRTAHGLEIDETIAHQTECKVIRAWKGAAYERMLAYNVGPLDDRRAFIRQLRLLFPETEKFCGAEQELVDTALVMCRAFEDAVRTRTDLKTVYRHVLERPTEE